MTKVETDRYIGIYLVNYKTFRRQKSPFLLLFMWMECPNYTFKYIVPYYVQFVTCHGRRTIIIDEIIINRRNIGVRVEGRLYIIKKSFINDRT